MTETVSSSRARLVELLAESLDGRPSLTLEQQRLWFLHTISPTLPAHVCAAYLVSGPLDPMSVQDGVNAALTRHDVLRANVVDVDGHPVRTAAESRWAPVRTLDLSSLPADQREAELARLVAGEARSPFDLTRDPLVRCTLARLGPDEHALVLVAHQMVADDTTADLFAAEVLGAEPGAAADGFDGIVAAEADLLESARVEAALEHWRSALDGAAPLALTTDHPRPAVRATAGAGAQVTRQIPAGPELADRLGVDARAVVLAGFGLVLARLGRTSDVTVGCSVDQRGRVAPAGAFGPLTNPVTVRLAVPGDLPFATLVRQADETLAAAEAVGDVPFERVVAELVPERDTSTSPLFQVRLAARPPAASTSSNGRSWQRLAVDPGLSLFDMTLHLDGSACALQFATDLWTEATAAAVLAAIDQVLQNAADRPETPVGEIGLLSPDAARYAAEQAVGQVVEAPDTTADRLVLDEGRGAPAADAVVCDGRRVTFAELASDADRLAHHLRSLGVGPERRVGVVARRSVDTVVAIFGVLRTGGAYVPLDPTAPPARTRHILGAADVDIVLTSHAAADEALEGRRVVDVSATAAWRSDSDGAGRPDQTAVPDNLAYCVFTSGSTGAPKGVMVTHRQIVNSTRARSDVFPGPVGSYLMIAPLFFDASCAGVLWALAEGARLVVPTERELEDVRLLTRLLEAEAVTHLDVTPSFYTVLLDTAADAIGRLDCVVSAGETLTSQLALRHRRAAPHAALVNEYGATEVAVWSTAHQVRDRPPAAAVPVGRAIRNCTNHLLDGDTNQVPDGFPGEIHVGGTNVARGYLGQPGLTAASFVPDPYGPPGSRLYRLGDVGKRLASGDLVFQGRADDQVKVRGFRVEPGEVELVLGRHPGVAAAAVVTSTIGGELRLVARATPAAESQPTPEELAAYLAGNLPTYMVPSVIEVVDALPTNRHGKTDRSAIQVDAERRHQDDDRPATPSEEAVATIFSEILDLDDVPLNADFFQLGGSSLHLTRLGARLSIAYDIDIPVQQFFTVPTAAGIAAMLDLYRAEGREGVVGTRTPAEVAEEGILDPAIDPTGLPRANVGSPQEILLTGATGYLGIFLLDELLRRTGARIHCLLRAESPTAGIERLLAAARHFRFELPAHLTERVRALPGDLSIERFGLDDATWSEVASSIDAIVHSGALVNFSYPYTVLAPHNVGGTYEVLRLATTTTAKAVHYVSTMDVLIGSHVQRPFIETPLPDQPVRVPFSYPESKWVAERFVHQAGERGVPVTIVRPGMMMGHSTTGACHDTDYIFVALRGFLAMGILPEFPEIMNSVTIDYAAEVITRIVLEEEPDGRVFHVWNLHAVPTAQVYEWTRTYGYDFEILPYDEALQMAVRLPPDHPLYPMLPVLFLYRSGEAGTHLYYEDHLLIDGRSECINALRVAERHGIDCDSLTEKWWHDCLQALIDDGWLPPPDRIRDPEEAPA